MALKSIVKLYGVGRRRLAKRVAEGAVPLARPDVREDDVVRGVVDGRRCGHGEEREPP